MFIFCLSWSSEFGWGLTWNELDAIGYSLPSFGAMGLIFLLARRRIAKLVQNSSRNYALLGLLAVGFYVVVFGFIKWQFDSFQAPTRQQLDEEILQSHEYEKNRVRNYLDWKKHHPEYGNTYDAEALPKQ
jgi:hypothetical protein